MSEWMTIRQLYRGCSRNGVLRDLVLKRLVSLSGLILLGFMLLALLALVMVSVFFNSYWLALVLPVVMVTFGLLGALVVDDRLQAVYNDAQSGGHDLGVAFRRGFLGVRYVTFRQRLQNNECFSPEVLEPALRCCDAERELIKSGQPRVRLLPVIGLTTLAMLLAVAAPWADLLGLAPVLPRMIAVGFCFVALLLLALVMAQPRGDAIEELRCLLVWALEDARGASQAKQGRV